MMKIEIPFNFNYDGKYFDLLDAHKEFFEQIDCVYMASFEKDVISNTRTDMLKYPKTEEEYKSYIEEFQKRGINVNILMQRNASMDYIDKYHNDYGINDFTINDNELARKIKDKYPNINLRLSITAKATVKDINSSELDAYDNIVLFFWYNRHLDTIKNLPKNHKYTILCNTLCLYYCPYCNKHWFVKGYRPECGKENELGVLIDFSKTSYIMPRDIKYFEDYISVFKLEGREGNSKAIFREFDKYVFGKEIKRPFANYDIENGSDKYNIQK